LAPSPNLEGCQRVVEPDLSPLLYKSKPELLRRFDHGIATKYCFKDKVILLKIPNFILKELKTQGMRLKDDPMF
jgi:hypothetical protein